MSKRDGIQIPLQLCLQTGIFISISTQVPGSWGGAASVRAVALPSTEFRVDSNISYRSVTELNLQADHRSHLGKNRFRYGFEWNEILFWKCCPASSL